MSLGVLGGVSTVPKNGEISNSRTQGCSTVLENRKIANSRTQGPTLRSQKQKYPDLKCVN